MSGVQPLFGIYGKSPDQLVPLKSIRFVVEAVGGLSSVTIIQNYVNSYPTAIEAEYIFPVDYDSAVTEMVVDLGDRLIEGTITEKAEAEAKYSDAMAGGHTAFMLNYDEKSLDLLRMALGNLLPGAEVSVRTKYVKRLDVEDLSWCIRIPLTYTPRYTPASGGPSAPTKTGSPVAATVPYTWSLDLKVSCQDYLTRLVCRTHKLNVTMAEGNREATAALTAQQEPPNKDLAILFRTANMVEPGLWLQKSPRYESYGLMLSFCPSHYIPKAVLQDGIDVNELRQYWAEGEAASVAEQGTGEFIFVLDCSGSMEGPRIELAKTALILFLKSLPVASLFNVVLFGTTSKFMFEESVEYNNDSVREIMEKVPLIRANMGGTEMVPPLEFVYKKPANPDFPRNILLITDGAVANPHDVVKLVKDNAHNTRVHSFGIGSGASRELVKSAAKAGRGSFQFAVEGEDLRPKVVDILSKVIQPALVPVSLTGIDSTKVLCLTPDLKTVPSLYYNQPFVLCALLSELPTSDIVLTVKKTSTKKTIEYKVHVDPKQLTQGEDVYKLTVKQYFLESGEQVQEQRKRLSLQYGVLSPETAFLAVQKQKAQATEEVKAVRVPIAVTSDTDLGSRRQHQQYTTIGVGAIPTRPFTGTSTMYLAAGRPHYKSAGCCGGGGGGHDYERERRYEAPPRPLNLIVGLDALIELQEVDGRYQPSERLARELRLDLDKLFGQFADWVAKKAIKQGLLKEIVATVLVLVTLEKAYADKKNIWGLIHRKSVQWLQFQGIDYAEAQPIFLAVLGNK